MKHFMILLNVAGILLLAACGGDNTPSKVVSPGDEKTGKDRLLNTGADLLQDKTPLRQFNAYLDGFHFYNGNTWHTDQHRDLPVGAPMVMMGFTKDGQLHPELLTARDKRFKVSAADIKKRRTDIPLPAVDPMANAWEKGEVRQFVITKETDSAVTKHK
ncbi:DUF1264 domain-containing protein [Chitinophaga oryzae]|uniref:DUF1264 domain-containing protein n=1 Tax=Chitinophaga oryzae TaxID=2725414 RepID=A0AAE6ZJK4_9BACT|nr:DUF1264 domain-containing protein [Chitinophaga oryzae]QJB32904.1 DUF1264 domain-containing protein [Chitinophaga oryzae]